MPAFDWNLNPDAAESRSGAPATAGESAQPYRTRREIRENSAKRSRRRESRAVPTEPRRRSRSARAAALPVRQQQPARPTERVVATRPVPAARASWRPKKSFISKVVTISAMFGAGALLVATSLPANALHNNAEEALAATSSVHAQTGAQSLAVGQKVEIAPSIRDAYTVVSKQARVRYGNQSFLYTNDINGTIQWPFPAPVPISSGFGARHVAGCSFCSTFHEGVDFTPGAGTVIGSIADGVVSLVSTSGPFGNHVMIDHVVNGVKVQSLYGHMLAGSIRVTVGQQVKVADPLGQVGSTGESTGAHLHLEVHLNGAPVDPFAWLKTNAN